VRNQVLEVMIQRHKQTCLKQIAADEISDPDLDDCNAAGEFTKLCKNSIHKKSIYKQKNFRNVIPNTTALLLAEKQVCSCVFWLYACY